MLGGAPAVRLAHRLRQAGCVALLPSLRDLDEPIRRCEGHPARHGPADARLYQLLQGELPALMHDLQFSKYAVQVANAIVEDGIVEPVYVHRPRADILPDCGLA